MRYPNPEEYVKAVQHRESFTDAELARMELVVHPRYQIPMPAACSTATFWSTRGATCAWWTSTARGSRASPARPRPARPDTATTSSTPGRGDAGWTRSPG